MFNVRSHRRSLSFSFSMLMLGTVGCGTPGTLSAPPVDEEISVSPGGAWIIPMNEKGQALVGGYWYDVWSEHNRLRDRLRRQADLYRAMYQQFGIPLLECRTGDGMLQGIPKEVIVEVDPRTKKGSIGQMRRLLVDTGFLAARFRMKDEPDRYMDESRP